MTKFKTNKNTCAFIDVLGYGDIVLTTERSTDKKIQMLDSIFSNLQSSISLYTLKNINDKFGKKNDLFIKSFSDSVFIDANEPYTILFSLYTIFSVVFGYYTNFNFEEKCTVLIRAGIVKDWTLRIMDLASLVNHPIKTIAKKKELKNIVGLGVARAYYTSEKSGLSGMRIIISPEVLEDFELTTYNEVPFECYCFEGNNLLYNPNLTKDTEKVKLFFLPIRQNEKGENVNLFELCWPVYKYSWSNNKIDIHTFVNEIIKIEPFYNSENIRHLRKTAELLYKSFEIALTIDSDAYSAEDIKFAREKLKLIANIK